MAAFEIARVPVSNASWMRFSEGGGYVRREWWSDEGWAWKEQFDITRHRDVAPRHPEAPVCHVSWFEADAFATAHDARLPTEAEWEKAATWDQGRALRTGRGGTGVGVDELFFNGYPGFRAHPYREYSRCSSARATACCEAARGRRDQRVASPTFRNWDLPSAGRSSPASGSRGTS